MRLAGCSAARLIFKAAAVSLVAWLLWNTFLYCFFLCVCDKCRRFDGKRASPTCVPKCCPLPDELFFFHLSQSVASANSKIITYSSVHSLRCVSLWRKCFVFGSPIEGARPNCDALTVCAWRLSRLYLQQHLDARYLWTALNLLVPKGGVRGTFLSTSAVFFCL